ncbi:MAG: serine hydrolase domain-containing protein [Thermoanaerobaculaceae bacterium]
MQQRTSSHATGGLAVAIALLAAVSPAAGQAPAARWQTLQGETRTAGEAQAFLVDLMERTGTTALSVAIVQDDRVVYDRTLGVVDRASGKRAGAATVLRTASLAKPVFAYLVMRLVDEGVVGLDQPLGDVIDPPYVAYPPYATLRDDPRWRAVTPAILLSHAAGFVNWRRPRTTGSLAFQFDPGSAFSYSGEGYYLLQFVLEKKTGRDLQALARERVFAPLGMTHSSFLWEPRFDGELAASLDGPMAGFLRATRTAGNGAYSLLTNAPDYARFMLAVLRGEGLKPATAAAFRTPRLRVTGKLLHSMEKPDDSRVVDMRLSWTPGWGWFQSQHGPALFHVGIEEGCDNFAVIYLDKGTGIVLQSNRKTEGGIAPAVVERLLGDTYSPFFWMRY